MTYRIGISRRAALSASAGILALAIGSAALAQDNATATTTEHGRAVPGDGNPSTVDELVVTVQKREELLSKVPASVSVVTQDTLERVRAFNFQDYAALVPGLSLQSADPGATRITLRGINTGGVASTVSIYVDDVPFGSSSGLANAATLAGNFDTFDVSRLEVLRGPQGTLYGASSLGGVIKYVTNAPSTKGFEGGLQSSVQTVESGGVGYSGSGYLNVPVSDKVAIRAGGFYRFDDGYIDSVGDNPIPDLLTGGAIIKSQVLDNFNTTESYGGRLSLLVLPTDKLSVRLSAILQNLNAGGASYFEADPTTSAPLYGARTQSRYLSEPREYKYRVYDATLDYDLGFANFTSVTSYARFRQDAVTDVSANPSFVPGLNFAQFASLYGELGLLTGTPTGPLTVEANQSVYTNKFTQEVRLGSSGHGNLDWLVGLYYTKENSAINPQDYLLVDPTTREVDPSLPKLIHVYLNSTYEEYAGFANATYHFNPRFDLTLGGRWSHNQQHADELLDETALGVPLIKETAESSEGVFTYSVAPRFQVTDEVSVYGRIASGYRPGGPNVLPANPPPGVPLTYKADRLTDYEVGLKGDWLNHTLSLDAAAYYLAWNDIQLLEVINNTGVNANGGTAVSKGVEVTATARPVRGLSLAANGAYQNSYLTEDTDPAIGGHDGDPLPYVPKWTGNLSADYEWPVMNDAKAFVGGTISFHSTRTGDFGIRTPGSTLRVIPSYTTLDLRAGVSTARWSIEAYARNLGNTGGITSLFGQGAFADPNAIGLAIIQPRTIGMTIGAKF